LPPVLSNKDSKSGHLSHRARLQTWKKKRSNGIMRDNRPSLAGTAKKVILNYQQVLHYPNDRQEFYMVSPISFTMLCHLSPTSI
jgi:hypothetical protein